MKKLDRGGRALLFRIIDDEHDFFALRSQWDELHSKQRLRLLDLAFFYVASAWTEVWRRKQGCQLFIICGEFDDGTLAMVWPLVLERRGLLRVAHSLGPGYYENCDILIDPQSVLPEHLAFAWAIAKGRFHVLHFQAIREDSCLWPFVKDVRVKEWIETRAPCIESSRWKNWDAYMASRSSKFRRDTGRLHRRLQAFGDVRFEIITD